jgi:hypothetical protein
MFFVISSLSSNEILVLTIGCAIYELLNTISTFLLPALTTANPAVSWLNIGGVLNTT